MGRSKTVVEIFPIAAICRDKERTSAIRIFVLPAAVANKKHFNHIGFPSCKGAICRVLPHFAQPVFRHILSKKSGKNPEMRQIEANRGRHS
jgi:hypothetical protein